MTKQEFKEFVKNRIVYLDGATGSNLQRRGMPAGICPELWTMEHPEVILGLQREYIAAGSNIIYAPTFSGNRIKLAEYGLAERLEEINTELVAISRKAADGHALVAGDLTMTGAQLEPVGDLTFVELFEVYKEQIAVLKKAGIDLLVVETMMSLNETRAAVLAAKEICPDLPVIVTLSFTESGNTLYGASAESAVVVFQALGADAVGLNCSAGPDKMLGVIKRMQNVACVPVIAKPNAGLPKVGADGQTLYDMDEDTFTSYMRSLVDAGAHLIGGCCGTTPDFIAKLVENIRDKKPRQEMPFADQIFLSDERQVYRFSENQELSLGDGIDFRKDADLLEEYQEELFDTAQDMAFDLSDDEADALLFCADGLAGEADILIQTISEVTQAVRMPVVIASANSDVVGNVLLNYSGIAAVMPLAEDSKEIDQIKKVAKHYGAAIVTLDKKIRCC